MLFPADRPHGWPAASCAIPDEVARHLEALQPKTWVEGNKAERVKDGVTYARALRYDPTWHAWKDAEEMHQRLRERGWHFPLLEYLAEHPRNGLRWPPLPLEEQKASERDEH